MTSAVALQRDLRQVRSAFGAAAEANKARLLAALATRAIGSARLLAAYHEDLLFLAAFPGSQEVRGQADAQLATVARRVASL
jgi:hypothetical protein